MASDAAAPPAEEPAPVPVEAAAPVTSDALESATPEPVAAAEEPAPAPAEPEPEPVCRRAGRSRVDHNRTRSAELETVAPADDNRPRKSGWWKRLLPSD